MFPIAMMIVLGILLLSTVRSQNSTTYYVNNVDDTTIGTCIADSQDVSSICSLRLAWNSCQLITRSSKCKILFLSSITNVLFQISAGPLTLQSNTDIDIDGTGVSVSCSDCPTASGTITTNIRDFPVQTGELTNTNSATQNSLYYYIEVCPGNTLTFSACDSFTGDTYFILYDSFFIPVAFNDDNCGFGSYLSYVVGGSSCSTYVFAAGCYSSNTCSAAITGTITVSAETGKPFIEYSPSEIVRDSTQIPNLNIQGLTVANMNGIISTTSPIRLVISSCSFLHALGTSSAPLYFKDLLDMSSISITNSSFLAGKGLSGGAVGVVNSSSPVHIANNHFQDLVASSGGAIFVSSAANMSLFSNKFTSCSAVDGGAIFIDSSSNIAIRDSRFQQISGTNGGAIKIYTFSSSIEISSSYFAQCAASAVGGAVMIASSNSEIMLNKLTVYNSSAINDGGALYIGTENSEVTVVETTIESCGVSSEGGAVYIDNENTNLYFSNCTFDNNYAGDSGGAIFVHEDNSNIFIISSQLQNNHAALRGGGMVVYQNNYRVVSTDTDSFAASSSIRLQPIGGSTALQRSVIVPSAALAVVISVDRRSTIDQVGYTGQASFTITLGSTTLLSTRLDSFPGIDYPSLYVPMTDMSKNASIITLTYDMPLANSAGYKPFGLLVNVDVVLSTTSSKTLFQNNVADAGAGGALFSYYSNSFMSLINTHFDGNQATGGSGYGGGAYYWLVNNGLLIAGCLFSNNQASLGGGALAVMSANAGGAIYNSNFTSNSVSSHTGVGGSLYASSSNGQGSFTTQNPFVIKDSYFIGSSATYGGGIGLESSNAFSLTSVIFMSNRGRESGGGMYCQTSNLAVLSSSILDSNKATNGGGLFLQETNQVNISATKFVENEASVGAGLVISTSSKVQFSLTTIFLKNVASFGGGGIYLSDASLWTMFRDRSDKTGPHLEFNSNIARYGSGIFFLQLHQYSFDSELALADINLTENIATGGGTIYWLANTMLEPSGLSSPSVVYSNNNFGYGEVATQGLSIVAAPVYTVEEYQSALTSPISIYTIDYYFQFVTADPSMGYTIAAEPPTEDVNCAPLQPSLSTKSSTYYMSPGGLISFTDVRVYCYPKKAMSVKITPVSNVGDIPFGLHDYYTELMTASTILIFRSCHVGEQLVSGECIPCSNGTYTFGAGVAECTSCMAVNGMDNCLSDEIYVSPGHWRRTPTTETILECPLGVGSCVGGWQTGDSLCGAGYSGPKCSICEDGYYSSNGACVACGSSAQTSSTALVLMVLIIVLALLYYFYRIYRFVNSTIERTTNELKRVADLQAQIANHTVSAETVDPKAFEVSISSTEFLCLWIRKKVQHIIVKVKILTATMQVITTCAVVFSVSFPSSFSRFTDSLQFINLNIYSVLPVGCGTGTFNFMMTLLWSTMTPILIMVLAGTFLGYLYVQKVRKAVSLQVWHVWRSRVMSLYFYLSYLVLPSVSVTIFQTFICENIDPQGEDNLSDDYFLSADMRISCSSTYYKSWVGYAVVMIFVYPIGIPLSYLVLLYMNRKEISTRDESTVPDDSQFIGITGQMKEYATMILESVCGIESQASKRRKEEEEILKQEARNQRAFALYSEEASSMSYSDHQRSLPPKSSKFPPDFATGRGVPADSSLFMTGDTSSQSSRQLSVRVHSRRVRDKRKHAAITAASLGLEVDESHHRLSKQAVALSFLWSAYEPHYWYWDVVEASRRIILTAVLSVIAPGTSSQNVLALLTSLLFIKLYGYYKPYISVEDDTLAELGQFQIFFTYLAAMTQQNDLLPPVYDNLVGGLLVLTNIILPFLALYYEVHGYYEEKKKQEAELFGDGFAGKSRKSDSDNSDDDANAVSCWDYMQDMWTLLITDFLFGGEQVRVGLHDQQQQQQQQQQSQDHQQNHLTTRIWQWLVACCANGKGNNNSRQSASIAVEN